MRLCKLPDIVSAAGFGAGRWLVVFGLSLMLALPVMRLAASYVLRGELSPSPLATPDAKAGEVQVAGGTPQDEARIRGAIDDLALRFDPSGVQVRVVADLGACGQCAAAYLPEMREILIPRNTVRAGGATLRWALAHEMGHYVDARYLDDGLRRRFMRLRGVPPGVTWYATDLPWQQRPAEDFGEVFAVLVQPTVERPIGTVYGRIRDKAAIEALLADAQLETAPAPASPWATAIASQARYMTETFQDPLRLAMLRAIALGMALLGALQGAWNRVGLKTCGPSPWRFA